MSESTEPWPNRSSELRLRLLEALVSTGSGPVKLGFPVVHCPDTPGLACKMTELPLAQSQLREFLSTEAALEASTAANDRPQRSSRVLAG